MKTQKQTLILCLILGIFTSFGCTKEGEKGEAGINGQDGNANVKSSVFTISSWTFNSPSYFGDIYYWEITQDIINSGAVLVYVETVSGSYSQLPLTFYLSSTYSSTLEVVSSLGKVRILWTDSDLSPPTTPPSMNFKIVCISSSARIANPNIDYSDYNQVKSTFGLED